jgi:hypothetical protein
MLTTTLDPFKQLAIERTAIPASPHAIPLSAASVERSLLVQGQVDSPARYKRALFGEGSPFQSAGLGADVFILQRKALGQAIAASLIRGSGRLASAVTWAPALAVERPQPVASWESDALPFLVALRELIQAERLKTAREMLKAAPVHILRNPQVAKLRSVLAPPVVRRVERQDVDRGSEYEWLRKEGHNYRGRWVAVEGDHLLATAASLRELRDYLRTMTPTRPPLLHRVD